MKIDFAVEVLLAYAEQGETVREFNGYDADERDIPRTSLRVCRIVDPDEGTLGVNLEQSGDLVAWASMTEDFDLLDCKGESLLIQAASLIDRLSETEGNS